MKKYYISLLLLTVFIVVATAQNQEKELNINSEAPKIEFAESFFNFGSIKQGDVVEHVFKFKNVGKEPLVLSDVKTSCGCTAPEWPRNPILPGGDGELKIKYNSTGKLGRQSKIVNILSNASNNNESIRIEVNVSPRD